MVKKSRALIGAEEIKWWPSVCATAQGAHELTKAIVAVAYHALEEGRGDGGDIPPLTVRHLDPNTGEFVDRANPAYEAVLLERALYYLQTLQLEADASTLEILADIHKRQLYMHHPDGWESLADFLRNMAVGKSASYQYTISRLVTVVLPFLHVEGLASVREMMELIIEGGMSNLYFLLPEMTTAVEEGSRDDMAELLADAKALGRTEIWDKYKRDKMRIPPAKATLTSSNPHPAPSVVMEEKVAFLQRRGRKAWKLTVTMNEVQKGVILNRLGRRIRQ